MRSCTFASCCVVPIELPPLSDQLDLQPAGQYIGIVSRIVGAARTVFWRRLLEIVNQRVTRAVSTLNSRPRDGDRLHTKRKLESWADFVDDLKRLVNKVYPELEKAAMGVACCQPIPAAA